VLKCLCLDDCVVLNDRVDVLMIVLKVVSGAW
jgi:hypothetical protein